MSLTSLCAAPSSRLSKTPVKRRCGARRARENRCSAAHRASGSEWIARRAVKVDRMQLRVARLCLDCEEIHTGQQCPLCASETFAYLSRWVPSPERRSTPRKIEPRPLPARKVIGFGVAGLGVMGLARWLSVGRKKIEDSAMQKNVGELK
jgi:hypothetical protein